jgi:uncharacterized glyoxalase superfamily protein PhnB
MSASSGPVSGPGPSAVISCLAYRDARAAIDWLCRVIGFSPRQVYEGPDNTIAHAELTLGGGMIMLGTVKDSEYGRLIKQPDEFAGLGTQSIFVVVPDADEVYRRAQESGAKIPIEMKTEDYGRGFSCYDPEGHLWNIGTYDPWKTPPAQS